MQHKQNVELSVVVPVYNESAGLEYFHQELTAVLNTIGVTYEVLYVNDGSVDTSGDILDKLAATSTTVRPLHFSRNFGKEAATTAGLHAAAGKAALVLDADGQHPVELIPDFLQAWRDGAKVIVGVRASNQKEGWVKRYGSRLFYGLLHMLGVPNVVPGATDFRLIDREVVSAFKRLTEHGRITRALIDWLGYDRAYIHFHAKPRQHGDATYSFRKLLQLALNGFVSLSFAPLYFSSYLGAFITTLSFVGGIFGLTENYLLHDPLHLHISGTAFLAVLVVFLVGILLICQGLLAVYVARIYVEVQNRPLYLIKDGSS